MYQAEAEAEAEEEAEAEAAARTAFRTHSKPTDGAGDEGVSCQGTLSKKECPGTLSGLTKTH